MKKYHLRKGGGDFYSSLKLPIFSPCLILSPKIRSNILHRVRGGGREKERKYSHKSENYLNFAVCRSF